VRPGL